MELAKALQKEAKLTTKEIGVASVFATKNYGRLVATPLCREAHFNASHRIHNPNWSDQKTRKYLRYATTLITTDITLGLL